MIISWLNLVCAVLGWNISPWMFFPASSLRILVRYLPDIARSICKRLQHILPVSEHCFLDRLSSLSFQICCFFLSLAQQQMSDVESVCNTTCNTLIQPRVVRAARISVFEWESARFILTLRVSFGCSMASGRGPMAFPPNSGILLCTFPMFECCQPPDRAICDLCLCWRGCGGRLMEFLSRHMNRVIVVRIRLRLLHNP